MIRDVLVERFNRIMDEAQDGDDTGIGDDMGEVDPLLMERSDLLYKLRDWIDNAKTDHIRSELQQLLSDINNP